ncbi:MAG: UDP-N-acetylmuramate dehydrogenase [Polyangiaceae bacterium]
MARPEGLREHVPLAPLTTLGVGGPARWYLEVETGEAAAEALAWARGEGIAVVVLGGGSNVLVADRGVDALVLRPLLRGVELEQVEGRAEGARVRVRAGAGESWDALVERAVEEGWAGLECLSGIPGYVGATPIQNVGAYGQEVAETIVDVRCIDRVTGTVVTLSKEACRFAYRDSVFKREAKERFLVLEVVFELRVGGAAAVRYPELERRLAELRRSTDAAAPSLAAVRQVVIELRRRKSMVIDDSDPNHRSAGSFFMNPIVDDGDVEAVRERARSLAGGDVAQMPAFPVLDETGARTGRTKLAAGWLIERAGFAKGAGTGNVGLSSRHALAVVNRGGATAVELLAFAAEVRRGVGERLGVWLQPEPVLLGFTPDERSMLGLGRTVRC